MERFKINQVKLAKMQLDQNNKNKKQRRTIKNAIKQTETEFNIDLKDFTNGINIAKYNKMSNDEKLKKLPKDLQKKQNVINCIDELLNNKKKKKKRKNTTLFEMNFEPSTKKQKKEESSENEWDDIEEDDQKLVILE